MNTISEIDLTQACEAFAIANTPLFLVRKLQADPAVHATSQRFSGQQLLDGLREVLREEPKGIIDSVRPYALLVALSLQGDIEHLRAASQISAKGWDWFEYIAAFLVETFSPITTEIIRVPGELEAPSISYASEAQVLHIELVPR
jgi:hypothetical protein